MMSSSDSKPLMKSRRIQMPPMKDNHDPKMCVLCDSGLKYDPKSRFHEVSEKDDDNDEDKEDD